MTHGCGVIIMDTIETGQRLVAKKQAAIDALEAQKQKLSHPVNMRTVMAKVKENGLTPEEIAEKLGLEV